MQDFIFEASSLDYIVYSWASQSYAVKPCLGDEWWAWDPEGCGSGSFRLTRKEL